MGWLGERAAASWYWVAVGSFLLVAAIESVRPDRRARAATLPRWLAHLGVYTASLLLGSAVLPSVVFALVTDRVRAEAAGVFAPIEAWGGPLAVLVAGFLAIDLIIYWMHRLEHRVPLLWRLHAVHHADPDMDVSTTLLHHPLAYVLTAGVVGFTLMGLGLPGWVFPVYAVFEVAAGAFQHVAAPVPDRLDRALRWLIVTPGMHQMHHSADRAHHDTNYASVLSLWDRLFGTFAVLDADARAGLQYGVAPAPAGHGFVDVMVQPFRRVSGEPGPAQAVEQA